MTMTQADIQAKIVEVAGADEVFRAQLLADPRDAIQSLTGTSLPDAIAIAVHQESATNFHLVLPPANRLTEEELAEVFGGNDWWDNANSSY